jgi:hypothetical protein
MTPGEEQAERAVAVNLTEAATVVLRQLKFAGLMCDRLCQNTVDRQAKLSKGFSTDVIELTLKQKVLCTTALKSPIMPYFQHANNMAQTMLTMQTS